MITGKKTSTVKVRRHRTVPCLWSPVFVGYLIGTGIVKLAITLMKKLGINATTTIMRIFGLNFMKYMKAGTLINFVTNWFGSPYDKMPLSFVKLLVEACTNLGIEISYHAGHVGTKWNIPHLHLGKHVGHLALTADAVKWIVRFLGIK